MELRGDRPLSKLAAIGHAALTSGRKRNIKYSPLVYLKQILLEYRHSNKSVQRARLNAEAHYALDPRFFEYKLEGEPVDAQVLRWRGRNSTCLRRMGCKNGMTG